MVQRLEPAETIDLDLIFLIRELVFQGTISKAKHRRNVFMAGTEYFGATAQPRHRIPKFCLSTPCGNHAITHFSVLIRLSTTTHTPSRLTQAEYHQITRKNSAYWQINTSELFSYTCLIQVRGCTVTR